jgi:hypothetical protein
MGRVYHWSIACATEAHLFITDMNQSLFNVGARLTLEEFSKEQVTELNRLYRSPLSSSEEIDNFMKIVAGHPFLVRRGLHEMATKKLSVGEISGSRSQTGWDLRRPLTPHSGVDCQRRRIIESPARICSRQAMPGRD